MTSKGNLITKREAADLLGVTPSSVHRMMDRGELTAAESVKTNNKTVLHRFRRSDVERLATRRAA
jgi:predicted DNA-binding transcriptional regulator AlpA